MSQLEPISYINQRLKTLYGRFETTEYPLYRVVWSEDEFEKRLTHYTDEGYELLNPEVRELPKYRQWAPNRYILERLVVVPEFVETDLTGRFSYEPLWVFSDRFGNPLPPKWEAIVMIIDQVLKQAAKATGAKYKDPEADDKSGLDAKRERVEKLTEELFGNETNVGDALAYREGVTVPHNFKKGTN